MSGDDEEEEEAEVSVERDADVDVGFITTNTTTAAAIRTEEMTFRYPSVVNDIKKWKEIGRLPKVKIPPTTCYDPAELTKDIMKQEEAQPLDSKDINNNNLKNPKRRNNDVVV